MSAWKLRLYLYIFSLFFIISLLHWCPLSLFSFSRFDEQWYSWVKSPRRRRWTPRARWSRASAGWSALPNTSTPCWEVQAWQTYSHIRKHTHIPTYRAVAVTVSAWLGQELTRAEYWHITFSTTWAPIPLIQNVLKSIVELLHLKISSTCTQNEYCHLFQSKSSTADRITATPAVMSHDRSQIPCDRWVTVISSGHVLVVPNSLKTIRS